MFKPAAIEMNKTLTIHVYYVMMANILKII